MHAEVELNPETIERLEEQSGLLLRTYDQDKDHLNRFRVVGYDRFATFDPTLFHKPKPC